MLFPSYGPPPKNATLSAAALSRAWEYLFQFLFRCKMKCRPLFSWWITTTTAGGADGEAGEGFAAQGMPRTLQLVDFDNSRMRRAMIGLSAVAPVTTSTNDSGTVVR